MQTNRRARGHIGDTVDKGNQVSTDAAAAAPKLRRTEAEYLATRTADIPRMTRRMFVCRRCQANFIKGQGVPDPRSGLGKCNSCLAALP